MTKTLKLSNVASFFWFAMAALPLLAFANAYASGRDSAGGKVICDLKQGSVGPFSQFHVDFPAMKDGKFLKDEIPVKVTWANLPGGQLGMVSLGQGAEVLKASGSVDFGALPTAKIDVTSLAGTKIQLGRTADPKEGVLATVKFGSGNAEVTSTYRCGQLPFGD
jgi:hypothetical protein